MVSEVLFRFFSCQASLKYHHSSTENRPWSRGSMLYRTRRPKPGSKEVKKETSFRGFALYLHSMASRLLQRGFMIAITP